jgi:HEAT repeat protein
VTVVSPPPIQLGAAQDPPAIGRALPPAPGTAPRAARGRDARSEQVLRDALRSADFGTRLVAIDAIARTRDPAYLEWLAHALGDPEPEVRLAAVDALARIEHPRARQLLASVRDDDKEDLDIRALAAGALLTTNP